MIPLLIDVNFDQRVLRGINLRLSSLDYVVVQKTPLKGVKDPALLDWAARAGRIIVTHDVNTIPGYAYDRIRDQQRMPGVIIVPEDLAIGIAIDDLIALLECSRTHELENRIIYLPI